MKKNILLTVILASMAAAIVTYFIPDLHVATYGLFTVSTGTLIYYAHTCLHDKQRRLTMSGGLILFLLAVYKFFNALGQ